jgi:hypothetical protein
VGNMRILFFMLSHLAFSQRSEITQTSVVALNKKAAYRNSFWVTNLWLIPVGLG